MMAWNRIHTAMLGVIALLLAAGVAAATMMFETPMVGETEVKADQEVHWTGEPHVISTSGVNCSVALEGEGEPLEVLMRDASPGAICNIRGSLRRTNSNVAVRVQDGSFNEAVDLTFTEGCGAPVGNSTDISLRLTVRADATFGTTPANNARIVTVLADDYDEASCPRP